LGYFKGHPLGADERCIRKSRFGYPFGIPVWWLFSMPQSRAWIGAILGESDNACLLSVLAGCAKRHAIPIRVGFLKNMSYSHF
jgi:hypothetical protein